MNNTVEGNKSIVSMFIEEFKNKANHNIVDELCAPDFVNNFLDPRIPNNREGFKMLGRSVASAFPDVHVTVLDLVAEGDRVVERNTVRATHTGEFNGIPPTGKKVVWTEIDMYRLSNGKIVEMWPEIDMLSLLTQIGAIPMPS
ncbi:MAG: ester cyclase [Thaumarchaeota archaeon]|nr:ester cyclase [Nitrososphaerota archaeon]